MPVSTRTNFVQLDRIFRDLKADAAGTDDADLRRIFGGKPTGWSELEAEHRVVLLAEPPRAKPGNPAHGHLVAQA